MAADTGSASPGVGDRRTVRSWKEIASHLGVTVRSAQRWESEGLPVRRSGSGTKAHVFAYTDELDRWLEGLDELSKSAPRKGKRIVLCAGAAILGGAILWAVLGRAPRVPREWQIAGSDLVTLDSGKAVCWRVRLPGLSPEFQSGDQDKVLIADVDGDGRTETLFNFLPDRAKSGSLMCFEQAGGLRWKFRYGGPKRIGNEAIERAYSGRFVRIVSIEGKPVILSIANHRARSASQAALIDPKTGSLIEEYWHPGPVYRCLLADLDSDSRDELLLGAVNNPGSGLGHAALAVLPLPFSRAPKDRSSLDGSFQAVMGGGESAYLLFPLPDVSRVAGESPAMIDLSVRGLRQIRVELPLPEQGGLVYYLDFQLNPLDTRISLHYTEMHERMRGAGLLDHRLSEPEVGALAKVVSFPAAPDGNSPQLRRFWSY